MATRKKNLKQQIKLYLRPEARKMLQKASEQTGYSQSLLIEYLIRRHLAEVDLEPKPVRMAEVAKKLVRTPKPKKPKQEKPKRKTDDFTLDI